MTEYENSRVDVNKATPSYMVDSPTVNMSRQELHREMNQIEYIEIVIQGQHTPTRIPLSSIVSMKKIIKTTVKTYGETDMLNHVEEYQPTDEEQEEAYLAHTGNIPTQRKPRKAETGPRATCFSTCCGTPNRRTRNGTCAGCRPNRYPLPQ